MVAPSAKFISTRIKPVLQLLSSPSDEANQVLNDWIEEQTWDVARDLWMATKPSPFQQKITVLTIGRNVGLSMTEIEYAITGKTPHLYDSSGGFIGVEHAAAMILAEAHRQLAIHKHARWVRLILDDAQTPARHDREVLLDFNASAVSDIAENVIGFRARCSAQGCVMLSYGTQCLPAEQRS